MRILALLPLIFTGTVYSGAVDSFKQSFVGDVSPWAIVGVGVLTIVIIGLLVLYEIKKVDSKYQKRAEVGWKKFETLVGSTGLSSGQKEYLRDIISKSNIKSADLVISSPIIFENLVDQTIEKSKRGGEKKLNEAYEMLHEIRDKLGYSRIPLETPYVSTRQLKIGDRIVVKCEGVQKAASSAITKVTEKEWSIEQNLNDQPSPGAQAQIIMTRNGDGEYAINTHVVTSDPKMIVLGHTQNINRKQQRDWVRVDVNLPLIVTLNQKDQEGNRYREKIQGRIRNISGGGLSIRVPDKMVGHSHIDVSFDLNSTSLKDLTAEVIRRSDKPEDKNGNYQVFLKFQNLEEAIQEKIVRYVFEVNRKESQWR